MVNVTETLFIDGCGAHLGMEFWLAAETQIAQIHCLGICWLVTQAHSNVDEGARGAEGQLQKIKFLLLCKVS